MFCSLKGFLRPKQQFSFSMLMLVEICFQNRSKLASEMDQRLHNAVDLKNSSIWSPISSRFLVIIGLFEAIDHSPFPLSSQSNKDSKNAHFQHFETRETLISSNLEESPKTSFHSPLNSC